MFVNRLIITPVDSTCKGFVRKNPSRRVTEMMMKERLEIGSPFDVKIPKVMKKLPKCLEGWVNPNCIVIK